MTAERQPIIDESTEAEPEPQPSTESAGAARPPGRIGSGLSDDDGREDEPPRDPPGVPQPELLGRWRDLPIEDLNLSMRAYNALRRSGMVTLGRIIATPPEDRLTQRNFGGIESLDEVRERVADVLNLGLWKTYRDYGLIQDWLETAYNVVRRSHL